MSHKTIGKAEAGQKLHSIADGIINGKIVFDGKEIPVADLVDIEVEAKGEKLELELKWKNGATARETPELSH